MCSSEDKERFWQKPGKTMVGFIFKMEEVKKTEKLLFRTRPVEILIKLLTNGFNGNYALRLSREIDCTSSHLNNLIHTLKKEGFLTTEKEGRKNTLHLTKKGRIVAEHLHNITMEMV